MVWNGSVWGTNSLPSRLTCNIAMLAIDQDPIKASPRYSPGEMRSREHLPGAERESIAFAERGTQCVRFLHYRCHIVRLLLLVREMTRLERQFGNSNYFLCVLEGVYLYMTNVAWRKLCRSDTRGILPSSCF